MGFPKGTGMLKIRPAQMKSFSAAALDHFERRALSHLSSKYPEYLARFGQTELQKLLKESRTQADSADLTSERGVVTWAELVICYGADFWQLEPWAKTILDLDVGADERLRRLRCYL